MRLLLLRILVCTILLSVALTARAVELSKVVEFNIPAQSLSTALIRFAQQTDLQIVTSGRNVDGLKTAGVTGRYSVAAALKQVLAGTGFTFNAVGDGTVTVLSGADSADAGAGTLVMKLASVQNTAAESAQDRKAAQKSVGEAGAKRSSERSEGAVPEILVKGSRVLNSDIKRSKDDPQPYVVFDRERLEQSGATTVEDFLKTRLTMNTTGRSASQTAQTSLGATSQINLRGLGTNQTLILIDGHRVSSNSAFETGVQSNINGIPLSAIERIEVLPTTASGIYGGAATGGVINIVLRRDYMGNEIKLSYENTFDSDAGIRRVDFSSGFSLEEGRTTLLFSGSYSDQNILQVKDRDFQQQGRAVIAGNSPASIFPPSAPPLGATTNIRSADGTPLFGAGTASFTSVPVGYAGGGGLAPLQANAGRYNLDLADTAQNNGGALAALLSTPTYKSLNATIRREFGPSVQAYLDAGAADNIGRFYYSSLSGAFTVSATAPNNPFGKALQVTVPVSSFDAPGYSRSEERRALGGLLFRLPREWQAVAEYSFSKSESTYSFPSYGGVSPALATAISNGSIDVLRDTRGLDLSSYAGLTFTNPASRTSLEGQQLRVAGPLLRLPAGPLTLSASLENQHAELASSDRAVTSTFSQYYPKRKQDVHSAYMEFNAPLLGGVQPSAEARLELQLAARFDRYKTLGASPVNYVPGSAIAPPVFGRQEFDSFNPTFAVRYRPLQDLMLRASYGTGFLPPEVNQLSPLVFTNIAFGADPRRGGTTAGPFTQIQNGTTSLKPEKSESWSAGLVLTPRFIDGLRLSVDYTQIAKKDNITSLGQQAVLDNESLFPGRVIRGANLPGDPAGWAGPVTTLDITLINIAKAKVQAYDTQIDYRKDTAWGAFDGYFVATWQTHYLTQLLPNTPVVENVGTGIGYPVKFKANAGLNWSYKDWVLGWSANYFDSYLVSTTASLQERQGNGGRVASQIYHDVFAGYRAPGAIGGMLGWLSNTELQLGIKNVLNKEPPVDVIAAPYYSTLGNPRLASYWLTAKKGF